MTEQEMLERWICEWQRSVCNEELVTLCQRVAELEAVLSKTDAALAEIGELAALKQQDNPQYLAGFEAGKRVMARLAGLPAPELYACTKCGGANYGCKCGSLKDCTKPLYSEPPVQQGEPVAWMDEFGNCFPLESRKYSIVGKNWKPLYTEPPTCFSAADMADAQAEAFMDAVPGGWQNERATKLREALVEIAGSKSLTATPEQFYLYLQNLARHALTEDAMEEPG